MPPHFLSRLYFWKKFISKLATVTAKGLVKDLAAATAAIGIIKSFLVDWSPKIMGTAIGEVIIVDHQQGFLVQHSSLSWVSFLCL